MLCDICNSKSARKMVDGIYRCPKCAKKAQASPEWGKYVKEVNALEKSSRRWIRRGKKYYKGRMI